MKTNYIKKKLKSNRGASLSIALLLFLVCAVLGSVILKTATAAAGRLVGVAEADQRYYSVNSAADLLAKELDGQTVHIRRAKVSSATFIHTYVTDEYNNTDLVGTETEGTTNPAYYYKAHQDDNSANSINKTLDFDKYFKDNKVTSDSTLLISAAYRFLFGFSEAESTGAPLASAVWDHSTPLGDQNKILEERTYYLDHDEEYGFLKARVVEQIRGDGTIIIVISNDTAQASDGAATGSSADDIYEVRLVFTPTIKNRSAKDTVDESGDINFTPVVGGESTLTEIETYYEYRYTAITWNLTEVEKAGLE